MCARVHLVGNTLWNQTNLRWQSLYGQILYINLEPSVVQHIAMLADCIDVIANSAHCANLISFRLWLVPSPSSRGKNLTYLEISYLEPNFVSNRESLVLWCIPIEGDEGDSLTKHTLLLPPPPTHTGVIVQLTWSITKCCGQAPNLVLHIHIPTPVIGSPSLDP